MGYLSKIKVTLDPGHSINYNRGIIPSYYESDEMFKQATRLKKSLEATGLFEVVSTKQELKQNPDLEARGKMAIQNGSRLFISLHSNAAGAESGHGTETFWSVHRAWNKKFALAVSDAIVSVLKANGVPDARNRMTESPVGVGGKDYYGVIRGSVSTYGVQYSLLIEHGFHTNRAECVAMMDDKIMTKIADATAKVAFDNMQRWGIGTDAKLVPATVVNIVKNDYLNVRTEPDPSAQIIGRIANGATVNVVTNSKSQLYGPNAASCKDFYPISYNGGLAYVSKDYLKVSKTVTIPTKNSATTTTTTTKETTPAPTPTPVVNTPTHTTPINALKIITKETSGKTSVLEISNWVSVSLNGSVLVSNNEDTVGFKAATVAVNSLNVRSGPTIKHSVTGNLKSGEKIYIKQLIDNPDWAIMKKNLTETDNSRYICVAFGYVKM